MSEQIDIYLDRIDDNPLQTRTDYDAAGIAEMAQAVAAPLLLVPLLLSATVLVVVWT